MVDYSLLSYKKHVMIIKTQYLMFLKDTLYACTYALKKIQVTFTYMHLLMIFFFFLLKIFLNVNVLINYEYICE